MTSKYSGIQFHGEPGITSTCMDAVVRLIAFGDKINKVLILSNEGNHCLLIDINCGDMIAIKSGFGSGYRGEGPRGFAQAIVLLERHCEEIDEIDVSKKLLESIDSASLSQTALEEILSKAPVRPQRWDDYTFQYFPELRPNPEKVNAWFPVQIPFSILDPRLTDLALEFDKNSDMAITSAYRKLEDIVRARSRIDGEVGAKLFAKVFLAEPPILTWKNMGQSENKGRANLFSAVFMAYRNSRAHKEIREDIEKSLREFLLINELFHLESASSEYEISASVPNN